MHAPHCQTAPALHARAHPHPPSLAQPTPRLRPRPRRFLTGALEQTSKDTNIPLGFLSIIVGIWHNIGKLMASPLYYRTVGIRPPTHAHAVCA